MVDARIVQTTKALHTAIVELASTRAVSSISVADVTRAAGINRATFYSHATSPGSLLTAVLTPELDAIRDEDHALRLEGRADGSDATRRAMEKVVDHVVRYREIYRLALPDPLDASIHQALARHSAESSVQHLGPPPAGSLPEGLAAHTAARHLAHGLVGASEARPGGKRPSRRALRDPMNLMLPTWWG
ncbi:TetR/AcrR family transcriptional regulator [Frigoribacterium sp. RIT-PI-h]|uniref:TetR/AcrR family transcriptional regulator n=1 Tax=Frigoribacterium sp. RIT-PI-h TaxID=1690245 RepID=UPI0006B91D73|nr:TetR/AcrR family transcriptional regulator [Frigoribacterium sp. RIT-PI-h]